MNVKTNISDQEGNIHSQENFPEQSHSIPVKHNHNPKGTIFCMRFCKANISKARFIFFDSNIDIEAVNFPAVDGKAWIKMFTRRIRSKYEVAGIKLRIF